MKTIIAGARTFKDYEVMDEYVNQFHDTYGITQVVSGTARGADILGEKWAANNRIPVKRMEAFWNDVEGKDERYVKENKFGKLYYTKAGIERNERMAEYADGCIVFLHYESENRGSNNMISTALNHDLPTAVIKQNKDGTEEVKWYYPGDGKS